MSGGRASHLGLLLGAQGSLGAKASGSPALLRGLGTFSQKGFFQCDRRGPLVGPRSAALFIRHRS